MDGTPVKLAPQPFKVLAFLVVHSGQLVTREDLRHAVWPDEVTVDFEHGLNTCIRQARAAVGDAHKPRRARAAEFRVTRAVSSRMDECVSLAAVRGL